jgi:hypothetical protein
MAPTSDERREVAARLRRQLRYMRENNCYEEDLNVVDCGNSAYRNIAGSVEPYGNFEKGNYVHIVERLADLIDPCPIMADEQMGKLRRRSTALASMTRIASDMSGWAGELADSCEHMSRARIADDVKRFADRIRQEARDALN